MESLVNIGQSRASSQSGCKFRIPAQGGRALWQITNVCNYSCCYCIFSSGPKKNRGELSTQDAFRVIEELSESGFQNLKVTGGEPFARKDLLEILLHAGKFGIATDLSTNASLIDAKSADCLKKAKLNMVHVSIDGPNQILQEMVRGQKTFAPTIRGVRFLLEAGHHVRIGTVIHRGNQEALAEQILFCEKLGVHELVFSIMEPAGRIAGDNALVTTKSTHELSRVISQHTSSTLRVSANFSGTSAGYAGACPGGTRFIYIDNLGRVSPCSWVTDRWPEFLTEKTLREESLEKLLRSPELLSFSKMRGKLAEEGRHCPVDISQRLVA